MLVRALVLSLSGLLPTLAGQAPDAAKVTEPGRTWQRPLAMFLGAPGTEAPERTLLVLLDPTVSLQQAGFAEAFEQALQEQRAGLARTRLGLGVVDHRGTVVLPPTDDHAAVARAIRDALQRPAAEIQNVYADLRTAAAALASAPGERGLLLVTLDNGDAEDDLEQTVAILQKARVRFVAITAESYVADSYWAGRPYEERPRGTTLLGGDAPAIDLPWGWLFQIGTANELTPSTFGPYAFSRLAAATEGRVHLFHQSAGNHQCGIYAGCPFCDGDHLAPDEAYWSPRTAAMAPSTQSRKDALLELGRDPWFRATYAAWKGAADAGLIRSEPAIKLQTTAATPDRQRFGNQLDLMNGTSFERQAKRAERAAADAGRLVDRLTAELAALPPNQGLPRQEATAHLTALLLQLTRVNLLTFAGWCREIAPELVAKSPAVPVPPEVWWQRHEERPAGIGVSNLCLCHGVRPFRELELPGGPAFRQEMDRLEAMHAAFLQRFGHSQYGFAFARAGIARFHLTYPGIAGRPPRVRPKSESETNPVTTPRPTRPVRGAPATGAGGPTTGGR